MKKFTWFLSGLVTGALGLFCFFYFMQHSETQKMYQATNKLIEAWPEINDFKAATVVKLGEQEPIESGFLPASIFKNMETVYQSSDGDIIFITVAGQLIWLHPRYENEKVYWTCRGEPKNIVLSECGGKR